MAIISTFTPSTGYLSVFGDGLTNAITLSRDAGGQILVNGGAVKVLGAKPTVANTARMQVFGLEGDDMIRLDETNGALPGANLFGGNGQDLLIGGSGADLLFGGAGHDNLQGRGGADLLFGGTGNDVLTGGDGDDQMFGEAGDDRLVWNPGDDNDLFEGGSGFDTAEINGGNGTERFTITANGTRARIDRVDPAPFFVDAGGMERIVINANGGNDHISVSGNMAALTSLVLDGGSGNDTILGGNGADLLFGGEGHDAIDGNQGNDVAFLGAGDDLFTWDPGDGSDVVEGQDGFDTMAFNGSGASETIDLSANGGRLRLTRDVGNITMDSDDLEQVDVHALGGADSITVRDLSGTDVGTVNIHLSGSLGSATGDGQADTVRLDTTNGDDFVDVLDFGGTLSALGLPAFIRIQAIEAADTLVIQGLGGDDLLNAANLGSGQKLMLDGGTGDDLLLGGSGADVLLGGDGDDFIDGNQGSDLALLGAGDDIFVWNPGDGNDTVEGQAGRDVLLFAGSAASENVEISANGGRVRMFRDVAAVTMDLDDVEKIEFNASTGADSVTINDLTGTDVTQVAVNLGAVLGSPATDAAADQVLVRGSAGADIVAITGSAGTVAINGLAARIVLSRSEGAFDSLTVDGGAGADVLDASALAAGNIGVSFQGGLGNDIMIGSAGDDLFFGGDGADLAVMGAGNDSFVWRPGDDSDVVEGQEGFDTLQFLGSNVAENISISSLGGRALMFRDIAAVEMDLNDVEKIQIDTLGGADNIVVNDLSGTDVTEVAIDLAGSGGAGDGQIDTVTLNATNGDDVILVTRSGNAVTVFGLSMEVTILNFEAADRLVINGLGGDDVIEASGLSLGSLQLTAFGGDGDDVLIGGEGADILDGGAGDDVMIGGLGLDIGLGGTGDNIFIQ